MLNKLERRIIIDDKNSNEERLKEATGTLDTFSQKCVDYLLEKDKWASLVTSQVSFENENWALDGRALLQLSERLGAGNFLPNLSEKHRELLKNKDVHSSRLEELFIQTVNTLKDVLDYPLLFRVRKDTPSAVRAVMSNQYVVINNYDLLLSCLEAVKKEADRNEMPIEGVKFDYEATDDYSDVRFYFVNDHIRFDDNYRGGIIVKNSECGESAFNVQLILFNTSCHNILRTKLSFGMKHSAERVFKYSDITNRLQAEVVYRKAAEVTQVLFNQRRLKQYYDHLIKAKELPLELDHAQVIMRRAFSQSRVEAILDTWRSKEDLSVYGLTQAITYHAQEVDFIQREKEEEFASRLVFSDVR